ncbi:MAG: hypothetical protein CVU05_11770, partial [Bacteroidetes bacterium HGW-Bacteroidetes-21]
MVSVIGFCQLSGTKNIPGDYPTIAAAIVDLNSQGVAAPGVTFNVIAGNPEMAPSGGFVIGGSGSLVLTTALNLNTQIIFEGNGNVVTASNAHVAGAINDAIFKIVGGDYITIQNFTLQENSANTVTAVATNNMTEWGVALLYASAIDGAQNNTIKNNAISLIRTYSNSFGIYSNTRHSSLLATTAADISNITGSNSYNKVFGNTISNVNMGIAFIGSGTAAYQDLGNDIGGNSSTTGNVISNWGGYSAASSYVSNSGTSYCIFVNHQKDDNVSYNTITSAIVSGTSVTFVGIRKDYSTTSPTGTFTSNITNNIITMSSGFTSGTFQTILSQGMSSLSTATININNNSILNCAITGASSSSNFVGISNSSAPGILNINSNIIRGTTSTATTGGFTGIVNSGSSVNSITINSNQIGNALGNAISFSANTSGAVVGISNTGTVAISHSIQNNDFRGFVHSVTGTSTYTFINHTGGTAANNISAISNNTFTNININTSGSVVFISHNYAMASTGQCTINNNSIVTAFNKSAVGGTNYITYTNSTSTAGSIANYTNNNFSNITLTGATPLNGFQNTDGGTGSAKTISGNTFSNWTGGSSALIPINITYFSGNSTISNNTITFINGQGAITGIIIGSTANGTSVSLNQNTISGLNSTGVGGNVIGIVCSNASSTVNISENVINTLSSTGASASIIGISITGATVTNVFQNIINSLSGSGATSPIAQGISVSAGATVNVYRNKIYDISESAAISTTSPAVTGLLLSGGTNVNAYNNLIGDLRSPSASLAEALRGISITSTASLSNYNVYYNTVFLNATSTGANFGTTGLWHTASSTSTTAKLDLRNNIIVDNSTPNGLGVVVAFRRSNGTAGLLANFATNSNNNLFYAGIPGPLHYIYYDNVNGAQTLSNYLAGVYTAGTIAPRDAMSVTQNPTFLSTAGSNANFLHIDPSVITPIESGAANIPAYIADFDNDIRQGNAGYMGTGSAPDIGADEMNGTPSYTCVAPTPGNTIASSNSICFGQSVNFTLQNSTPGTGVVYQWQNSTDNITYSNISGANATSYIASPAQAIYYQCVVTCMNGPSVVSSIPVQVTYANTVSTTTPGSRCGTGSVVLEATGSAGSTLKWYSTSTGGVTMGTGSPFNTPIISSTNTYYVGAETNSPAIGSLGTSTTNQNTTSTWPAPYGNYDENGKHHILILASELNAAGLSAGNINSLAFNVASIGSSGVHKAFTMSIANTSLTALTSTLQTSGFTTVFGPVDYQPIVGTNTHTFSTPYLWDGASNIIVEVCFTNDATSSGIYFTQNAIMNRTTTSYNSVAYLVADNVAQCPLSTGASLSTARPNMVIAGTGTCSSPRTAVIANVSSAAPLSITGSQTVCNNSITMLTVTSNLSDYDSYIWTPVTDLYSDAGATIAYIGGTSATTVYSKSAIAGSVTYSCTSNNSSTSCANVATTSIVVLPAVLTITSSQNTICISGSAILSAMPATGYGAATFQWQNSTDNIVFTDIAGANSLGYTTPTITNTTYYKLVVKVSSITCTESNVVSVVVNNPSIVSTTPAIRCGAGAVTLGAAGSAGTTLNWYAASSGGSILGTGTSFTTPIISATTNYWVEASGGTSGIISVGPVSPTAQGGVIATQSVAWNVNFTTLVPTTIKSVDIFPMASGQSGVIQVRQGSTTSGTLLATINYTTTVSGGTTPQTILIDFNLPAPGSYNLYTSTLPSSGIRRNTSGAVYPYVSSVANITGNGYDNTYFMGMYNWVFTTECVSSRQSVLATINTPPSISATSTPTSICAGESATLEVSSSNSGYTYSWLPFTTPSTGSSVSASPLITTIYTVTATDNSGGANNGCSTTTTVNIGVNPLPSVVTVTPNSAAICSGSIQQLTASGGTIGGNYTFGTATTTNTTTGYPSPYTNYFGGTKHQMLIRASELIAAGMVAGPINSVSFTVSAVGTSFTGTLSSFQIRMKNTSTNVLTNTSFDSGLTLVYGPLTQAIPTTGLPAAVTHAITPFFWDGISNIIIETSYSNANSGISSDFVQMRNSDPGFVSSNWYYADGATPAAVLAATSPSGSGNARPNIVLNSIVPTTITWIPTTDLYTDAIATTLYTGSAASIVYAKPASSITYTAIATTGFGCTSSGVASITVNPLPTINLTSPSVLTICEGGSTDITLAFTGTPPWNWIGDDGSGPSTFSVTTSPYTASVNPTSNTTYSIISVTDDNGCTNSSTQSVAVTVDPISIPGIATASDMAVCSGNGTIITLASSVG